MTRNLLGHRWIFSQFIMMDANFHLRLKTKNIKNDVALGDGQSYFVKDNPYKEHLKSVSKEKEVRKSHLQVVISISILSR